jgi:hypothetical protein
MSAVDSRNPPSTSSAVQKDVGSPLSHKWTLSSPAARKARPIQNKMDHM